MVLTTGYHFSHTDDLYTKQYPGCSLRSSVILWTTGWLPEYFQDQEEYERLTKKYSQPLFISHSCSQKERDVPSE